MIFEYQGKKVALSGDAVSDAESEFVESVASGSGKYSIFTSSYTVDVIKLGHHGSSTSSSNDYINAITTSSATKSILTIASCGLDNSYGHPHESVYTRLNALGFIQDNHLRTDLDGDILVTIGYVESLSKFSIIYNDTVYDTGGVTSVIISTSGVITWFNIVVITIVLLIVFLVVLPTVLEKKRR